MPHRSTSLLTTVPAIVLAFGLLGRSVAAQGRPTEATIRGQVLDAAGLPVRHAEVAAREERSGAERGAAVDAEGRYVLRTPAPGRYTLRVRAIGYEPVARTGRVLAPGEELVVDVRLTGAATALTEQVVTATRSAVSIAAVPGAVTVVTRGQLEAQARTAPRLGPMLAQLVPGLGAATENLSNFGQNIRGRAILVLVDGVPQSTSRNVSRDFINIDPAMVERVEVVRGATSVYGNGATGGVVNIITRRAEPGDDALRFGTELSTEASLSRFGAAGLGPRVVQRVSGVRGGVDVVASAAFSRTGALFDAEGDRVPPDPTGQGGFAETNNYDLFAKAGRAFGARGAQRLELSANHFRSRQATDLASDFSINTLPAYQEKSRTLAGLELPNAQGTRNTMVNAEYTHAGLGALLGSRLLAQAYARDYHTVFRPFDDRRYRTVSATAANGAPTTRREYTSGHVMQTYVNSAKAGGRLQAETPLSRRLGATVLWGADYTAETTEQPVHLYDSVAFVQSGGRVFRQTGGAPFVPPLHLRTLGLFAQAAVAPVERVVLRGGVRHERASVGLDDFTALNGVAVRGGALRFDPVLVNAGAVVTLTPAVNAFANYSEGFSLADVGLVVRQPPAGFSLGDREAQPQQVSQVEAGVRGSWARVQASATAFRNTSELGTSVGANLRVVRAPERVRGVELTLDAQPAGRVSVGGTYTWTEGEFWTRVGGDSVWQPLNTFRIQPPKLTAHVEHRTRDWWRNRVQVLYSGVRDRAHEAFLARPGVDPSQPAFGERRVASYALVDVLSTVDVGRGTLGVGVRNLLNRQYFPIVSQLMPVGNVSYSAAPGATLSVGYSVSY